MKKILCLGIIISVMLFTLPISASTSTGEYETYLYLRGWLINPQIDNNTINAQAIKLRYRFLNFSGNEYTASVIPFAEVSFNDVFIKIPLGNLCFVWGYGKSTFSINNHPY